MRLKSLIAAVALSIGLAGTGLAAAEATAAEATPTPPAPAPGHQKPSNPGEPPVATPPGKAIPTVPNYTG